MTTPNTALADILDRRKPEEEAEQLLAALIDFGVFVPVGDNGSVIFMKGQDEEPVLPGYVSEECCRQRRPGAVAVHCDVTRLLDIGLHTKTEALALYSEHGWATVPLALVAQTLRTRGMVLTTERTVRFSWSTHPMAVALRDTLRERLLDHPDVRCVWIAQVRWMDTGMEHLMLHMALADAAWPDTSGVLMEDVLSRIELGAETREVVVRVLRPASDADAATMRELDTMGLDTVRADHAARRVEVISREYDAHPAAAPAPAERPRRWWRR
ncbi:hypothetical protein ACIP98_38665 [Streptomyces sp. NPDC088354]|uniref:hypothetical protein n=1 Tax=Streptomyces sp. NPDC088354 TaxID=3365856 RepID=UPI00382431AD